MAPINPSLNPGQPTSYLGYPTAFEASRIDRPMANPVKGAGNSASYAAVNEPQNAPVMPGAPATPAIPVLNVIEPVKVTQVSPWEALFKDLGQGLVTDVTSADALIKNTAEDRMRERYRQIQADRFGVGGATATAAAGIPPTQSKGDSSNPYLNAGAEEGTISVLPNTTTGKSQGKGLPAGAQGILDNVEGYQDMYHAGLMSNSYYLGVMNAEMSKFKTQYPGYESEVEEFTKKILGVDPANALRTSLMNDADAKARATAAGFSSEFKEVLKETQDGHLYPTAPQDYANGTKSIWDLRKEYGTAVTNKFRRNENLDILKDDEETKRIKTRQYFVDATSNFVISTIQEEASSQAAQSYLKQIQDPDFVPTNEDIKKLQANLGVTEQKLMAGIQSLAHGVDPKTGKMTLANDGSRPLTYLKPDEYKTIVENAMGPFELMQKKAGVGDLSAVGRIADQSKYMNTLLAHDIEKNYPVMNRIAAIKNKYGPEVASLILTWPDKEGKKLLDSAVESAVKFATMGNTTKDGLPDAEATVIRKVNEANDSDPKTAALTLDASLNLNSSLLRGDVPTTDAHLMQVARAVYSSKENIFDLASSKDYPRIWNTYSSPAVMSRLKDITLKQGGDITVWNQTQKWVADYFPVATREDLLDLSNQVKLDPRLNVEYNPKTTQFELTYSEQTGGKLQRVNASRNTDAEATLNKINANLFNLAHVAKLGGRDVDQTVQNELKGMGIDFIKPPLDTKGMQDAIKVYLPKVAKTTDELLNPSGYIGKRVGREIVNRVGNYFRGGLPPEVEPGASLETINRNSTTDAVGNRYIRQNGKWHLVTPTTP